MKKIIRLTESDLARIIKRIIKEDDNKTYFSVDEKSIYTPQAGYGGGNWEQTVRGSQVWLNNYAQTNWPVGDAVKTKKAAQKLLKAMQGLDITGSGAKMAQEVANEWKNYSLIDQNEFLRQWYKLEKTYTPWQMLFDDYENDIADQMINSSIKRVNNYCKPYAEKKTLASRGQGTVSKNVICDLFVTNDLRAPGWGD